MTYRVQNKISMASSRLAALALCAWVAACSGGSSGSSGTSFTVSTVENFATSATAAASRSINQPILFKFSAPVDFTTVDQNSISVELRTTDEQGNQINQPSIGTYTMVDDKTISYQPRCPLLADLSDAGLLPGGNTYVIRITDVGGGSSATILRSTSGAPLQNAPGTLFFKTPTQTSPNLFSDETVGPPNLLFRSTLNPSGPATNIVIGGDSANPVFFTSSGQVFSQPGTGDGSVLAPNDQFDSGLPLNLYSSQASRLSFFLIFNQPVDPRATNINTNRIRLEAERTLNAGDWRKLPAEVQLIQNCTASGATLRVRPVGVLPQGVRIRVVLGSGFGDLSGVDQLLADVNNQVVVQTRTAGALADEILESFTLSAFDSQGNVNTSSLEDSKAAFADPRAKWGSGQLSPAFNFDGTGGPGNNFDLIVGAGQNLVINTDNDLITSADFTQEQVVVGGRIDLRNLVVQEFGTLEFNGTNRVVINVTGTVTINGTVRINGRNALDVAGVSTATFPQPGATGNGGGGKGGDASREQTGSTASGDAGNGAFATSGRGGGGGETGYGGGQNTSPTRRRGGGGGGGVLGSSPDPADILNADTQGLFVTEGGRGAPTASGALDDIKPPTGGTVGPGPFVDSNPLNDFFGTRFFPDTGAVIAGELANPWAGAGGGGGGDCVRSNSFPHPQFSNSTDDKGGGGGSGAGGIHIRALSTITFGPSGKLQANGGNGARGQTILFNGNFFVLSGGAGGGGSGGHVILETADQINLGTGLDVIEARGGMGGPETQNNGVGAGGSGGPGLIQLHVPDPDTDIVLGGQMLFEAVAPLPLTLVPSFGARSRARSKWISLGGAVGLLPSDVNFTFEGIDKMAGAMSGAVLDANMDGIVDDLPTLLNGGAVYPLATAPTLPSISATNDLQFLIDLTDPNTDFSADPIYVQNPALLRNFILQLVDSSQSPAAVGRFNIESAQVNSMTDVLTLTVSGEAFTDQNLTAFVAGMPANFTVELLPRYFRIVTAGLEDSLPVGNTVRFNFQGTGRNIAGEPDVGTGSTTLTPWTADVSDFSDAMVTPSPIEFFRFEVEFNLDTTSGLSPVNPRPVLQFLRLPFEF